MSSEPPKPGAVPGWGQSQPDAAPAAPAPAPVPDQAPGGAIPGWGQQPASQPAAPAAPAAPPAVPTAPPPIPAAPPVPGTGTTPGWGAAAAPTPPTSTPPPAAAPPSQPGWGTPPAGTSPAAPPSSPTGWGAPAAPGGTPPGAAWNQGPAAPGGTPPGAWNPQPAASSGSSGCLKIILILLVVGAILFGLLIAGLAILGNRLADSVGIDGQGNLKACPLISNATLSEALGSKAQAVPLEGFFDATLGIILDKRVLPDAEDCWITADSSTATGRIARYVGGDAAAVFQKERQKAAPTSEDQGGGISVTNEGYFGGEVGGFGDEAFCTGVSAAIQAGVLVRKGNTLVYVSLSGPSDGTQPAFETTPDGVVTAPSICARAQAVARRMLP